MKRYILAMLLSGTMLISCAPFSLVTSVSGGTSPTLPVYDMNILMQADLPTYADNLPFGVQITARINSLNNTGIEAFLNKMILNKGANLRFIVSASGSKDKTNKVFQFIQSNPNKQKISLYFALQNETLEPRISLAAFSGDITGSGVEQKDQPLFIDRDPKNIMGAAQFNNSLQLTIAK
jgi:hypothetical protein